jgi:hypothetical protein
MKNRKYTNISIGDAEARNLVDEIASAGLDVQRYREVMTAMGKKLAQHIVQSIPKSDHNDICVVCTVEDADFLAQGVVDVLTDSGLGSRVKLLCLWNEKVRSEGVSLSPVVRQYKEDATTNKVDYIIVKSIISGACVVKTNLTRALSKHDFGSIFVASPVMLDGADRRLALEFPPDVAKQFQYFSLATDFEKSGEDVLPGIGGSVYERLGLGDSVTKNKTVPTIVKTRRERFRRSAVMA